MLRELVIFLLGAVSIGLAFLLFSVELPIFDVWDVLHGLEVKYVVSFFTAFSVFLLFVYAEL